MRVLESYHKGGCLYRKPVRTFTQCNDLQFYLYLQYNKYICEWHLVTLQMIFKKMFCDFKYCILILNILYILTFYTLQEYLLHLRSTIFIVNMYLHIYLFQWFYMTKTITTLYCSYFALYNQIISNNNNNYPVLSKGNS